MGGDEPVSTIEPGRRSSDGRVQTLRATGPSGSTREVAMTRFRGAVGFNRLRSTWVTEILALQSSPPSFRFRGRGWGHGVGLCQIGARGLANEGKDAQAILRHYYPGTRLEKRR
jgi:SpoIID/LytB domain protein